MLKLKFIAFTTTCKFFEKIFSSIFFSLERKSSKLFTWIEVTTKYSAATDAGYVRIVWPDPDSVDEVTLPDVTSGNGAGTDVVTDPDQVRTPDSGATDPSDTASDPVDGGQDPVSPPDATTPALIDPDSGSGGSTALWIGIGIALAVAVLGMGAALTRRSRRSV